MSKPNIYVLENGLRLIFIKNKSSKSIAINLRILAGSNNELENEIGSAHLLEHILITKNKENIIYNGSKLYGVTSRNDCLYYIKSLKENFEENIKNISNLINLQSIEEEELTKEKQVVIQEIKRILNNPEREILRRSYKLLFPNTRLSRLNTGEIEDIETLKKENLLKFFYRNYTAKNIVLCIVGNLNIETIKEVVARYLGNIKQGNTCKLLELSKINNNENKVHKVDQNKYQQTHTRVNFYGHDINSKNKYAIKYIEQISNIYMNKHLKYEHGIVAKITSEAFSSINYGTFSIYACSEKEDIYKEIIKELKNLYETLENIDIDYIKNIIINNFIFEMDRLSNVASFYSENYLFNNKTTIENELKSLRKVTIKNIKQEMELLLEQKPKILILK